MKKFIAITLSTMLFVGIFTPKGQIFAAQNLHPPASLTIEQALQLALDNALLFQDINAAQTQMQMQHRDLRNDVNRLESGNFRAETVRDMREELLVLEEAIFTARRQQLMLESAVDASVQQVLGGLVHAGNEEADFFLNQALSQAMSSTAGVQGLTNEIAMMEIQRSIIFTEISNLQDETQFRALVREARHGLDELERQMENLALQQDMVALNMENVLRGILADMSGLEMMIEATQAELALAEFNMTLTELRYKLGMISSMDVSNAHHQLAQARDHLNTLSRHQVIAMQNLNHMLGLPLSEDTVITFDRGHSNPISNIEQHIAQTVPQTINVQQLELDLASAIGARRVYTNSNAEIRITEHDRRRALTTVAGSHNNIATLRNRITLQDAVDRARTGLEQAERSTAAAMHRAHTNFTSLVAQEAALQRDLTQAQANLNATIINFELGYVTQFDIDRIALTILVIQQDIERVLNDMWIQVFVLENPSLLQ